MRAFGVEFHLTGLHPILQAKLTTLQAVVGETATWSLVFTSGLRTLAAQEALYRKGRDKAGRIVSAREVVTMAAPGYSWHNFGLAADFALVKPEPGTPGTLQWSDVSDMDADGLNDWEEVGHEAEKLGLEWGGRWKKFRDFPHVQMTTGLSLEEARHLMSVGTLAQTITTRGR